MSKRQPPGGQDPVVERVRVRYAKRGPMRFTSHRDFARALERAIHRAAVPIAYSQGFTPHPKISFASAAPTGVASEAEYLELGLRARADVTQLRDALDAALSPGLDVLEVVSVGPPGTTTGSLADRITASHWRVELPGVRPEALSRAVGIFLQHSEVLVERLTKQGKRDIDARAAIVHMSQISGPDAVNEAACAILDLVVRQVTPSVRPDDVLSGLRVVASLESSGPGGFASARATRLAQGALTEQGEIVDPLA